MKLKLLGIVLTVCVFALLSVRIYGAFQTEADSALARAEKAEQEAKALQTRSDDDQRKVDCSNERLEYKNHLLEKQIAELEGRVGHTPTEPGCEGYAMGYDRSMSMSMEGLQAILDASAAREYAGYEREYSADRKLQAKFLGTRVWTFLKGAELKSGQQAQMQMNEDVRVQKLAQAAKSRN